MFLIVCGRVPAEERALVVKAKESFYFENEPHADVCSAVPVTACFLLFLKQVVNEKKHDLLWRLKAP